MHSVAQQAGHGPVASQISSFASVQADDSIRRLHITDPVSLYDSPSSCSSNKEYGASLSLLCHFVLPTRFCHPKRTALACAHSFCTSDTIGCFQWLSCDNLQPPSAEGRLAAAHSDTVILVTAAVVLHAQVFMAASSAVARLHQRLLCEVRIDVSQQLNCPTSGQQIRPQPATQSCH